ncbi:uncharacterized protein LOC129727953 isoform X2 [Wyeomyia smithii]|uniref:uncharacterized protein LOC129727953 isoform X2 n=1 Tax=Wyeomyia smithii TaxID=174621 RepID=UPI002468046E|nr:uncharacterized protein LOC129727953 isoform X2 [Wyeomyia smithii]
METGKQQIEEDEQRQRSELTSAINRFMRRHEPGKFVRPLSPIHDNGAAGSDAELPETSHKVINRKVTEKLTNELSRVKAELEMMRLEKEKLCQILANRDHEENEFYTAKSSTMREEQATTNETFLTTMSNMSRSTLNIPECAPIAGETELNKRSYDHWKNVLNASMNLIQATDESTKMNLFRIKAGPLLLELLDGTNTQEEMPDEKQYPFLNAIARLDAHFDSRAYVLSQRSKLANMVQSNGESNIQYVQRVAAASKLCSYKQDEEFEAISRTVTRGSTDSRIRTFAYRVLINGGSLNDLMDRVRSREVELQMRMIIADCTRSNLLQ